MQGQEIFCSSCRIKFEGLIPYKEHVATEFHAYNAKRRTQDLPPISQTLFSEKQRLFKEQAEARNQPKQSYSCKPCGKIWKSEETYKTHINSKKHRR